MTTFSQSLINEYKAELADAYGVFVDDAEAQSQLLALTRSMFPTVLAEQRTESRELGQGRL